MRQAGPPAGQVTQVAVRDAGAGRLFLRREDLEDRREKYRITRGGFTTCVQPTPRWRLTSGTVVLNLEHYAVLTNSLFKVKGMPGAVPADHVLPDQQGGPRDRVPDADVRVRPPSAGTTLSNAFFWAINRSQDATFLYDWYSKTGPGLRRRVPLRRRRRAPMGRSASTTCGARQPSTRTDGEHDDHAGARELPDQGSMSQRLGGRSARAAASTTSPTSRVQQTYNQNVFHVDQRQRVISGSVSGMVGQLEPQRQLRSQRVLLRDDAVDAVRAARRESRSSARRSRCSAAPLYFSISGEARAPAGRAATSGRDDRSGPLAIRHLSQGALPVHEVAVPDALDERGVPRDVLDRAARSRKPG